ncbi:Palmitoyltransferase erf2 [Schizosaccharomyces pombe]
MSYEKHSDAKASRYAWNQPWNPFEVTLSDPTYPMNLEEKNQIPYRFQSVPDDVPEVPHIESRYKNLPGNNIYLCCGRLQMSSQYKAFLISLFALILPGVLFFIFSAFWLWHHVSPAVPITFAYLYALAVVSMFKCSTADPGILPRNAYSLTYNPAHPWSVIPEDRKVLVGSTRSDSVFVNTVYCHTCHLYRPPRASHCHLCDNCVEYLDHHCVWLNTCIGRRNYRYYFIFLLSVVLSALYLTGLGFYTSIGSFHESTDTNFAAHLRRPWAGVSFFLGIYGALGAILPGILFCYQCYLISVGQNVHEYLRAKNTETEDVHPFHDSIWLNFLVVLCRPKNVSYVRPTRKSYV